MAFVCLVIGSLQRYETVTSSCNTRVKYIYIHDSSIILYKLKQEV